MAISSFAPAHRSHRALMTARATSDRAKAAIAELARRIEDHEIATGKRETRRSSRRASFEETLGAMVGELLYATTVKDVDSWLSWPLDRNVYTHLDFSHRDISNLVETLMALRLLEVNKGRPHFGKNDFVPGGPIFKSPGYITTMRLTKDGCDWFEQRGLTGGTYADDFDDTVPLNSIVLRESSRRFYNRKIRGKVLPTPRTPQSKELMAQVERLNAFLLGFDLRPVPFRGLYRGFNEAERVDFKFDRGGRLYGFGNSYQSLSEAERLRMKIDGEPVAEIDISSSYLTVVYGLFGLPFDNTIDQYAIEGFERELVKKWTAATLSAGEIDRWPAGTPKDYQARTGKKIPLIATIRTAMEAKHPVLTQWAKSPGTWSTLMFMESGVILETMETLMLKDIPAYPIHDSIVVRERDTEDAAEVLANVFVRRLGVEPSLEISTSKGTRKL